MTQWLRHLCAFLFSLVLVCGGPAYASPPPDAHGGGDDHGEAAPEDGDVRTRRITSNPAFVALPPLISSIQNQRRLSGTMHIELGLDVPDNALRQKVQARLPRLRDAYMTVLANYTGVTYQYGDVPNASYVARQLQRATDHTLGERGATVVLGMIVIYDR